MRGESFTRGCSLGSFVVGVSLYGGVGFGAAVAQHFSADRPAVRSLAAADEKKEETKDEKKEDKGEKIALDKLPKKVVENVKKEMPGAKLTRASKKVEEGKTFYFLDDVKLGKKEWDLKVAEDGTILKKEECHDD